MRAIPFASRFTEILRNAVYDFTSSCTFPSFERLTFISYKYGLVGSHNVGFFTPKRNSLPTSPLAVATTCPLSNRLTSMIFEGHAQEAPTVTANVPLSILGIAFTEVICAGATGSIHKVCQIPDTGVYQIPSGLEVCFPRG